MKACEDTIKYYEELLDAKALRIASLVNEVETLKDELKREKHFRASLVNKVDAYLVDSYYFTINKGSNR